MKIGLTLISAIVSFILFFIFFFPLEEILSDQLAKLESSTRGQYRVSVSEVDASLFFYTTLKDLQISEKTKSGYIKIFSANTVRVRVSLLSMLSREIDLRFQARLGSGSLEGEVRASDQEALIGIRFDKTPLERIHVLNQYFTGNSYSLSLNGKVDGEAVFGLEDPTLLTRGGFSIRDLQGRLSLKVFDFQIRDLQADFAGQIKLNVPKLQISDKKTPAVLESRLSRGRVFLSDLSLPGEDLILNLKGNLQFNNRSELQRSRLSGGILLGEALTNQVPMLKELDSQKDESGRVPLRFGGTLKKPEVKIGDLDLSPFLSM
jgi:type II secretion system protein N